MITQVTTRKNGGWWQNGASRNGGTMLWISGKRFADNFFALSPTANTSNQVYLVNGISSYPCEIHPDKVTSTQITCYSPLVDFAEKINSISIKSNSLRRKQEFLILIFNPYFCISFPLNSNRSLAAGSYFVRVFVEGKIIPTYQYAAASNAFITVRQPLF